MKRFSQHACFCLALTCCAASLADEVTNSVGMRLQLIDAGRFEMGEGDLAPGFYKDHPEYNPDNDERPIHPVVITRPFYLATTEVTVAQFRQFVEATKYVTTAEKAEKGAVGWDPAPSPDNPRHVNTFRDGGGFSWKNPGFEQANNHPVTCVSYTDAIAYCKWLSEKEDTKYRLPTEAEWEYAARAGTNTLFSFGDKYQGVIHQHANIGNVELEKAFPERVRRQWLINVDRDPGDEHVFTSPVGAYEANPWKLHDVYGNVWEWCEDRYLDTAYNAYDRPGFQQVRKRAINPLVTEKSSDRGDWRVIRGGSWFSSPIQARSGVRSYFEIGDAACYIGFRVVRTAPEEVLAAAQADFELAEAARMTVEQIVGKDNVRERRDGRLTLQVRRQHLNEELFAALAEMEEPVDIYLNAEGKLTKTEFDGLVGAKHLTGLVLGGIGSALTDADLAPLAKHPELELLELSGNANFTNALFEYLQNHDQLRLLQLEGEAITDAGLQRLPKLEHLETLHLRQTASEGLVLERFQKSPLRTFSCKHLTDPGAAHLIHFPRLHELSLDGSPITGSSLQVISKLPWLNRLILNGCSELKDEDFAVLGNVYELQTLSLPETAAGDAAMEGISRLNYLRDLNIGSSNLTDKGLKQICSLVSLHNLTLPKEATEITDDGLTDLWRLANLRGISLEAPKITGSGLATIHELPELDRLDLGSAGLEDVALKNIAKSKSIKRLFLGSWSDPGPQSITDAGVLALGESPSLTSLDIRQSQTQVTDGVLEQVKQRRPELNVRTR